MNINACQLVLAANLRSELDATFLSGNVNLVITGCVLFCDTVFSGQLFSWNGIHASDTLFNFWTFPTVSPVYSDLPEYGYPLPNGAVYSADDSSGMPAACHNLQTSNDIPSIST